MSEEIRNAEEQPATATLEIKLLDRNAPISDTGRMPIEVVRKKVIQNPKNIVIGAVAGKKRIGLYRNTYKLITIEIENGNNLSDSQIREFVGKKILAGEFDIELTETYNKLRNGSKD
jgi:hypothetical protein